MKLHIKVKTGAINTQITKSTKLSNTSYMLEINIKSLPIDGKANKELIKLLSKEFKITQVQINIKLGQSSKNKLIELLSLTEESVIYINNTLFVD